MDNLRTAILVILISAFVISAISAIVTIFISYAFGSGFWITFVIVFVVNTFGILGLGNSKVGIME